MSKATDQSSHKRVRVTLRIRPGRVIIIRPPILRRLGIDPAQLMIEQDGNRLVVSKRLSPKEASLARLKARLADRAAAVEQVRQLMNAAPRTADIDLRALIDEGRA